MIKVVPSIIPRNIEQMTDEINLVSGFTDFVQIDISDGIFTRYKTWPYNEVDVDFFNQLKSEQVGWPKWEKMDFEVHLMIDRSEDFVEEWLHTGVSSLVVHIESTNNFQKIIDMCREHQVVIWLAMKPSTDISRIEQFISSVDGVQVMGSDLIGKHGVELEDNAVEMIKKLHKLSPETIISVDIGVNLETKDLLLEAGATKFICGSAILDDENPKEVFEELSK